jgi:hypothetical protein
MEAGVTTPMDDMTLCSKKDKKKPASHEKQGPVGQRPL